MENQKESIYLEKNGMSLQGWIITIASAIYVVSPVDFVPDAVPVVGWMDDVLAAITGITTAVNSQLNQANTTFSGILKFIRLISFSLWAILGVLILIFGILIYQVFN